MTPLHDQFTALSKARDTWLGVLDIAFAEGVIRVKNGYFTANPEWISAAIPVFRSIAAQRDGQSGQGWTRWNIWRWRLDMLVDHIRHFRDADLEWSETLASTDALDRLLIEANKLKSYLEESDDKLDAKWEAEWKWSR